MNLLDNGMDKKIKIADVPPSIVKKLKLFNGFMKLNILSRMVSWFLI